MYLKGGKIIRDLLVNPKEKIPSSEKCNDLQIQVCQVGCEEEYTGESGRAFGERFKVHLKMFYLSMINPTPNAIP